MPQPDPERTDAILRAALEELPNMGIIVIAHSAEGLFRFSTNMNANAGADVLLHVVRHLRGECKC